MSDQPQKKSGLKVEMDIAAGKIQGLSDTGKKEPGRGHGESGQSNYAEQLPDQYHPATDMGDSGFGFQDTGAGKTAYGNNPVPTFDFGKGPGQRDIGLGFQYTGPSSTGILEQNLPDEPVKGGQSTQGGAFTPATNPDLNQPAGGGPYAKTPLQVSIPGTMNPPGPSVSNTRVSKQQVNDGTAGTYGIESKDEDADKKDDKSDDEDE